MNNGEKKQIPLRVSEKLFNAIAEWAEDDFRSINVTQGLPQLLNDISQNFPTIRVLIRTFYNI